MAAYLVFYAFVIKCSDVALLDTRKVQRIGYAVLAVFAAGFLYDVKRTTNLIM